jgi:sulfate permease, SulP family
MSADQSNESTGEASANADSGAEFNLPGLRQLREAIANYAAKELPGKATLRQDGTAGLNSAIVSLPDGMANSVLAGVSPIYGLYACIMGPITGGLLTSSRLMVISTTSASALAAGQALGGVSGSERASALFIMVILIGILQFAGGLLGAGRLTRFVSYSVMTGFLAGVAVVLILSQLPTVAGVEVSGNNKASETLNLMGKLGQVDTHSLALAIVALVLAVLLPRTRIGKVGTLIAIAIPSVVAAVLNLNSVQLVKDVGEIPRGLPTPAVPAFFDMSLDRSISVSTGALAVAAIILVQGAGVSQSAPNPDGTRSSSSRDFIAQGAANVVSGLFRGLPVGGSVSSTALSVVSGARTRWAAVMSGIWVALVVLFFVGAISNIVMPALGALLIVAGVNSIHPADVRAVWRTGWPARLASVTTFLATLLTSIQIAVGLGVVLSALLYVIKSSSDISIVELVRREDGRIEEQEPPSTLSSDQIVVLDVYGSLFFAGARTLERRLPRPDNAHLPVVILRLRGHTEVGATLIEVLSSYADKLADAGGRLYLTGLGNRAYQVIRDSNKIHLNGPVRAYEVTPVLGQSTQEAYEQANAWLIEAGHRTGAQ